MIDYTLSELRKIENAYRLMIGESSGNDDDNDNSELKLIRKFLEDNLKTINEGINFLDKKSLMGFKRGIGSVGYKPVIVPDDEWNKYKNDPTETSGDLDNRVIRIKESYFKENPGFFEFNDEYGWSWHEFGHAFAFSGAMDEFLKINSPFGYPMNTDEIFTFGFQIRHLDDSAFNRLVWYESSNSSEFVWIFNMFREVICT